MRKIFTVTEGAVLNAKVGIAEIKFDEFGLDFEEEAIIRFVSDGRKVYIYFSTLIPDDLLDFAHFINQREFVEKFLENLKKTVAEDKCEFRVNVTYKGEFEGLSEQLSYTVEYQDGYITVFGL
uniref:Uncharacterized protein n=1 Tax=Fervidobacterium pennivorans TaxID=93466 RepID=A0A7V4KDR7_FERPE